MNQSAGGEPTGGLDAELTEDRLGTRSTVWENIVYAASDDAASQSFTAASDLVWLQDEWICGDLPVGFQEPV